MEWLTRLGKIVYIHTLELNLYALQVIAQTIASPTIHGNTNSMLAHNLRNIPGILSIFETSFTAAIGQIRLWPQIKSYVQNDCRGT